jgi:putative peptide zinc metalloprotease protein
MSASRKWQKFKKGRKNIGCFAKIFLNCLGAKSKMDIGERRTEYLETVSDIRIYHDRFLKMDKFFLSSDSNEVYLKISREQYLYFKMLLPYLDGSKTKQDVERLIGEDYKVEIEIDHVVEILEKHGLMLNSVNEGRCKVELDLYSDKLKKIELKQINAKLIKFDWLIKIIFMFTTIVIGTSVIWLIFDKNIPGQALLKEKIDWKQVSFLQVGYIFLISILSIFIHELGHILCAVHFGVTVKSMNIVLKFGIIPAFYVRYKELYTVKTIVRIKVLLGGIYVNLFLASLFTILYSLTGKWMCMIVVLLNVYDIIGNLSPLTYSDGYHIFVAIFGKEGFRWSIVKKISMILRGKGIGRRVLKTENIKYLTYFLISLYLTFISLKELFVQTLRFFQIELDAVWIGVFIIICIAVKMAVSLSVTATRIRKVS